MRQPRPHNHVTEALGYTAPATHSPVFPEADLKLILKLEESYPARCLGTQERVEDHLRYAGKVELIALLRADYNARVQSLVSDDLVDTPEDVLAVGERAS